MRESTESKKEKKRKKIQFIVIIFQILCAKSEIYFFISKLHNKPMKLNIITFLQMRQIRFSRIK